MDVKAVSAGQAYGAALGRATGGEAAGSSFTDLLAGALGNMHEAAGQSEGLTALALNKQADLLDVVTAVGNAEMTVETVVAVRDKVINAYNEIMRMQI